MNTKDLEDKYIGKRVRYAKSGNRHGWLGTVAKIDLSRVVIAWEELEQDYRLDALVQLGHKPNYYDGAYLELLSDTEDVPKPDPSKAKLGNYVVSTTNKVLESFDTEQDAITFATEQVIDSKQFIRMSIFSRTYTVQAKRPKIEVLNVKK
jgi:hypothetical protein